MATTMETAGAVVLAIQTGVFGFCVGRAVALTDMRAVTAKAIAPILRATGFRFSKDYRWGVSRWHRAVYATVSTVRANELADS
jgi:protein-disulfide isomerase-like protein with CxxC motif